MSTWRNIERRWTRTDFLFVRGTSYNWQLPVFTFSWEALSDHMAESELLRRVSSAADALGSAEQGWREPQRKEEGESLKLAQHPTLHREDTPQAKPLLERGRQWDRHTAAGGRQPSREGTSLWGWTSGSLGKPGSTSTQCSPLPMG